MLVWHWQSWCGTGHTAFSTHDCTVSEPTFGPDGLSVFADSDGDAGRPTFFFSS